MPLFAAATAHEQQLVPEISEAAVSLRPMTAGSAVEDYGHIGLSLRSSHPVAFLRDDLRRRRIFTCQQAMDARDGRWLEAAGIVLVRQRPGSAKGVMFITLEDEIRIANLVVWPQVFEKNRRIILMAGMFRACGRIPARGRSRIWSCAAPHRFWPTWPASVIGMRPFRCRTDAAMNSITARRRPIRVDWRQRACARATSTFPTSTSTRSK